ncbi:unnamed protein product [marine sediment metagenome]|uniref:Uncharacterized protein n=1 Tax=marine sediment metagenome TaxID=412755 RepID=X0W5F5_9ZZZZ
MTKLVRVKGLSGGRGLATAIIHQATVDACRADPETMRDAWAYLGSEWYRLHADALGIPPDTWPVALEHSSTKRFIEITDKIMGGST